MYHKIFSIMFAVATLAVFSSTQCMGGDLDDKISIDDNVSSYDNLGNPDQNIKFVIMNAKSNAKRREILAKKGLAPGGASGKKKGSAMNSVVMGAGSNVRGDIIIIDESKGDKTQITK